MFDACVISHSSHLLSQKLAELRFCCGSSRSLACQQGLLASLNDNNEHVLSAATIVQRLAATVADYAQSLRRFKRMFVDDRAMRLVDACIIKNLQKKILSSFRAARAKVAYVLCVRTSKIMISHKGVLARIADLRKGVLMENSFGLTHIEDQFDYTSPEESVRFITYDAVAFLRKQRRA